jgi:hypothetical protein
MRPMCAACAIAAAAGATGVRSWLQAHHMAWLTSKRIRIATIALFVIALAISSIGFSGSTKATSKTGDPAPKSAQVR